MHVRRQIQRTTAAALEAVLVVGIVLVAVLAVARPLLGPSGLGVGAGAVFGRAPSVAVTVDPADVLIETEPRLPTLDGRDVRSGDALEFTLPTGARVAVHDPDPRQRLGLVGAEVLAGLATLMVLIMLLRLVRSLRRGDPFVPANARRLYAIAATVGLAGQGAALLGAWGRAGVLEHPLVSPYVVHEYTTSFVPLLAGLGIAVAAEVFRQGAELRREVEGLV